MPIKFRCKYCEQFLGISKSRAGADVDCPQCGRAIRVPGSSNQLKKMSRPGEMEVGDDSLLSALAALSSLADNSSSHEPIRQSATSAAESAANRVRLSPAAVEAMLDSSPAIESAEVSDFMAEPEYSDHPIALSDSLGELADWEMGQSEILEGNVSDELLKDMQSVRRRTWISGATVLLCLSTFLAGLIGGWCVEKFGLVNVPLPIEWSGEPDSDSEATLASNGVSARKMPVGRQSSIVSDEQALQVLQGAVQYQTSTGQLLPDSGALILLLPIRRKGSLLFDAQVLSQGKGHPDFVATMAALDSVGAKVVWANQQGLFAVACLEGREYKIVVVSQNVERPGDAPIPQDVDRLLSDYFQSTDHLCGRLALQVADTKESTSLDFQFAAQQ